MLNNNRALHRARLHRQTNYQLTPDAGEMIDMNWTEEQGDVTRFSIQYRTLLDGKWTPVYRIDNYHGTQVHEHRLWRGLKPVSLEGDARGCGPRELLDKYQQHLQDHWQEYKRNLLEARIKNARQRGRYHGREK